MKDSLTVGNESIGSIETKIFENLEKAKELITLISNELEYHQKQSLKYALKAGESLLRNKEPCLIEKKYFSDFLKECNINWSICYV
jgi:hypothetical protein